MEKLGNTGRKQAGQKKQAGRKKQAGNRPETVHRPVYFYRPETRLYFYSRLCSCTFLNAGKEALQTRTPQSPLPLSKRRTETLLSFSLCLSVGIIFAKNDTTTNTIQRQEQKKQQQQIVLTNSGLKNHTGLYCLRFDIQARKLPFGVLHSLIGSLN
jgi:hypothetical protein